MATAEITLYYRSYLFNRLVVNDMIFTPKENVTYRSLSVMIDYIKEFLALHSDEVDFKLIIKW